MIAELQDERQRLDEAIEALERLSAGQSKRKGRSSRPAGAEDNGDSDFLDGNFKSRQGA